MTYPAAITALKAKLDAITGADGTTLSELAEKRFWSLSEVDSKAAFDGRYLLRNESGAKPWPEETNNPVNWYSWMTLEIGTELLRDALEQSETVEDRSRLVTIALQYTALATGCIYDWQEPEVQRIENDKRILWVVRFKLRYSTP